MTRHVVTEFSADYLISQLVMRLSLGRWATYRKMDPDDRVTRRYWVRLMR